MNVGEDLLFRVATEEDAPAVLDIYRPFIEETAVSFEEEAPSVGEVVNRIRDVMVMYPWIIVEKNGEVAGYAYASPHRNRASYRWSIDVSVYLAPGYRGKGLGRALYKRLLASVRGQGFYSAYAGITLPNRGSVGLHEAVGFYPVGTYQKVGFKFGKWHDVGWWQLSIQAPAETIREPIPFPEFRNTPEFQEILKLEFGSELA